MLKEAKERVPAWYIGNISFDKHLLRNLRGDGLTIRIICGLCMISGRHVYQNTAHLNTIYITNRLQCFARTQQHGWAFGFYTSASIILYPGVKFASTCFQTSICQRVGLNCILLLCMSQKYISEEFLVIIYKIYTLLPLTRRIS